MNGIAVVQAALASTQFLLETYLSDLDEDALLARPVPNANHIAWQVGHLINAEAHMIREQIPDAEMPALPEGFGEKHVKETATCDDPASFHSLAEYKALFGQVRQATINEIGKLSDEDLDRETVGNMAKFAPRLGDYLMLVSNHTLMHGGQFSVLRRKLDKPVLF